MLTGAEITDEDQSDIEEGLGFFNTFLLVFAVIALFVGSFIIYNSFSILVAQRSREMALLRAIGASRRQVLGSVLLEAVVVGLVASVVGLVAGIGVAVGPQGAARPRMGIDIPAGGIVAHLERRSSSRWSPGSASASPRRVLPARRASRRSRPSPPCATSPSTARRQQPPPGRHRHRRHRPRRGGHRRTGLFGGARRSRSSASARALVFVGVAVLGPVLARPLSRVLGCAAAPPARACPARSPGRTPCATPSAPSATAAALMIGVALVGFITILASSTKASIGDSRRQPFTGDLVIDSGTFAGGGLDPQLAAELAELPEVGGRQRPPQRGRRGRRLRHDDRRASTRRPSADVFDLGVTDGALDRPRATPRSPSSPTTATEPRLDGR